VPLPLLHERGDGAIECLAARALETRLHESPGRLVSGLPRDMQRRIPVVEPKLIQHRTPLNEVRAFIEPEKIHDARELSRIQVGVRARAQAWILRIVTERELAVPL